MTPIVEITLGIAVQVFAFGVIAAAEIWRPTVGPIKTKKTRSWRSNDGRWPDDDFLRAHGFRIKARPDDGPAIWHMRRDDGTFFELTEIEAIKHVCDYLDKQKARNKSD